MFNSAHLADNNIPPGIRFYIIDVCGFFSYYYNCSVYKGSMLCQFVLPLCVCLLYLFIYLFIFYISNTKYCNVMESIVILFHYYHYYFLFFVFVCVSVDRD